MRRKIGTKALSLCMALALAFTTSAGVPSIKAQAEQSEATEENILKLNMDATGYLTPTAESQELINDLEHQKFSWDNATVYFVLTDRFLNGDSNNDHSYGRGLNQAGTAEQTGLDYKTNPGTFHGGDIKGLTTRVEEGYFTDLGVNAIWITAPYEQIHGYTSGNVDGDNARESNGKGFPYYSYHGYWTLDYTSMDANVGTAEEFEKFVDSCHERGIRVVMDIVLNHTGYITIKDCLDLGMTDALNSGAVNYYFGDVTALTGGAQEADSWYNLNSDDWANKWWGTNFVRVASDYKGYKNVGKSAGLTSTLCGLPDIYTESTTEVALPGHLKTLWAAQGRYDEEVQELDVFFSKQKLAKTPRNYVIKWLTDWVREYGIDGFRCDTAGHVDVNDWKVLKDQAVIALEEWRQNNPDKPGADWTDEFWVTGEAWGHGVNKDAYFTTSGFDSMINFNFPKDGNLASLESTYSSYATSINSDEDFNVLSYLTSHDDNAGKGVFGSSNNKNMGTSLLLAPGGVQIYYGNELNRGLGWVDYFTSSDYLDQRYRTDMNWDSYDEGTLKHWQKLGQFRNKHLSVGAGQHEKLSDSPYTFSRTYHLEEDDEDKVVIALPGSAGTYDVNVGDIFEEGETITDYYSGKTYTVSGSSVSATCDANGVILLEGSGIVKPSVNAKAKNGDGYKADTLSVTLKANKVTDTYYSINGGTKKAYNANDVIAIGGDTAYGEETTLVVEGKSEEDGTTITKTFTYTRSEEPIVTDGIRVEASKTDFPIAPNIFVYTNDATETPLNGAWPGAVMEDDGDCWVYTNDEAEGSVRIILSLGATGNTGGTWRSTADKVPGLVVEGGAAYTKDSTELTEIPVGEPGKVIINYVDTNGNTIKSIYRVGAVGKTYNTYEANLDDAQFEGYTLTETPSNATGTFEAESTVTYVYTTNGDIPPVGKEFNVSIAKTLFTYDGTAKELKVVVKDGSKTLTEGTDYEVTYANNINACTDTTSADAPVVTVTGKGDYADMTPVKNTFAIGPKDLTADGVTVSDVTETYTYTGSEFKPTVEVKDTKGTITTSDYEISYTDNKNAGTAKITVTGKGNYTGTVEKEFTISKAEIPANAPDDEMVVSADVTKLSEVTLKGDWKWENADTEIKLNESVEATAYYDGADKVNYNKVSVTVNVTKTDCKHDGATERKGKVDATCATDGYTGDECCSLCGAVINYGETVNATGEHSGGVATCIEKAECKDCHAEYGKVDSSNHTGETEIRNAVEATCKKEGYTGDTYCKDCGKKIESGDSIAKTGHTWDAGKITKEPTATEEGKRTYTCTVCNETKVETIAKREENPTTGSTEDPTPATTEKPITPGTTEKPTTPSTTEKPTTPGTTEKPTTGNTETSTSGTTETQQKPVVYVATDNKKVKKGTSIKDSETKTTFRVTSTKVTKKTVEYVASNTKTDVVIIPDKVVINGTTYKVTSVSDDAFKGKETIKGVTIGKNVKTIGENAFKGCDNLEEVVLPNSTTTIGDKAFYQCTKLKAITIPSKVSKIGKQAFFGCKNLKKITIKTKKLTSNKIGSKAFKGISSKATIKVPKSKVNAYKKLLKAKGLSSKATVKK